MHWRMQTSGAAELRHPNDTTLCHPTPDENNHYDTSATPWSTMLHNKGKKKHDLNAERWDDFLPALGHELKGKSIINFCDAQPMK